MNKDILQGKKIVLGVTGCIAAYKSAYLVRELKARGCSVKVVMTPSAAQFIAPLTFSSLTGNEVIINIFPSDQNSGAALTTWHIELALWADLILIAPCTINTTAKIAHGFADNALTTLVSAARCPAIISPAADVDMYNNKITQKNISALEELGFYVVHAEEGELASGLSGKGRLPEIEKIINAAELILSGYKKDLTGKKILISAGPTYEDIDPVRFIGNRSSGKMGYDIAKAAFLRGAEVTLISGPSNQSIYPEIKVVKIRSASEMKKAVNTEMKRNDVLIMAAAVADYKPDSVSSKKIKKEDKLTQIKLVETEDILQSVNKTGKVVVGFALETDNELANAKKKMKQKDIDMIILNSLKDAGSGFEKSTNKIAIIKRDGSKRQYPLQSKFQAANCILTELLKL